MNNIRKILVVVSTFLLCIAFGLMCYFALDNRVKADGYIDDPIDLVYSTDFGGSMPDYNRVISNSTPFYDVNSARNVTFDYFFSFEGVEYLGTTYVKLGFYEYHYANNTQAQNATIHFNNRPTYSMNIFTLNANTPQVEFKTDYASDYAVVNDSTVGLTTYCNILDLYCTSGYEFEYYYKSSSNRYYFTLHNVPFIASSPCIYISYGEKLNHPPESSENYNDCWGFSSFREDYFAFNYNVFSYYYFNYGKIDNYASNCYWTDYYRVVFGDSSYNRVGILPNTSDAVGWHCSVGLIVTQIDFQPSGRWISYKYNPQPSQFYSQINFNYYVNNNLINYFNSDNTYYDSTYLYRQDVQWYDIFGHLYNFVIYLIFDMPLISNITKPLYMLISGTTTTFNWLAGCVAGMGIFGAFAMCYLLFAIVRRLS